MAFLADTAASLAASLLGAVARLLCRPCYDDIQNTMQVLSSPESVVNYLEELREMADRIKAMSSADEIENWISEADKILQDSRSSNLNDDRQSCCFMGDACLRCKLQKKTKKMIAKGNGIIKLAKLQPKMVEQIHGVPSIKDDSVAGRNLRRVMNMLTSDDVWMIGLWGPGGVGKTTLAKALNNKLEGASFCSRVIFIQLTKDVDVKGIQKDIAKRLDQNVEEGMDSRDVAEQIRNRLQREKFLLILDNVWECIDLPSIGIPKKQVGSKIVLTTRLLDVCRKMKAVPFEIEYLTDEEAWQLFAEKAGDVVDIAEIRSLAETVCQECGRLPLALVAVGSAMSGEKDTRLWESAIYKLQRSIPIDGVDSHVYSALRLSYEWLENDTLRSCFLYCSLYPEGMRIAVDELVECWLAEEKMIDDQLYWVLAINEGLDLITKLMNSCLLEFEYLIDREMVKMHDVVRDFARWTAESNGKYIIFSGHGISRNPMVTLPKEVNNLEWISFVDNKGIKLPQDSQDFPKTTTLLLHGTGEYEVEVSDEFLKGFQSLKVLNMRYLQSFPGSSFALPELRALILVSCNHVEEIPCMPKLMILHLCFSPLDKIPTGVRHLTHLKVLNLSFNYGIERVEGEIISNLKSLEHLDMVYSGYKWPTKRIPNSEEATLQDLSGLTELKSLYIDLADVGCSYEDCYWMERLQYFHYRYNVHKVQYDRKTREICIGRDLQIKVGSFILHAETLHLEYVENPNRILVAFNVMDQSKSKIKKLILEGCRFSGESSGFTPNCVILSNLETLSIRLTKERFLQVAKALGAAFPRLSVLEIIRSPYREKRKNLLSFDDEHVEFPKLEKICIYDCGEISEVFHYGPTNYQAVAPNLKELVISDLPTLQRLCTGKLIEQWQSLEILEVSKCPNLKKLPQMTSIKVIRGEEEWWNNLEWDSPEIKSSMNRFFKVK